MRLLAAVLILPIIEISLFVTLGGWLTLWPTLAIVIATAALGVMLLRRQGTRALRLAQQEMAAGRNPISPLAHGLLISAAGVLLVLPGFFTDALGLILLIPPVRQGIIWAATQRIADRSVSAFHRAPQAGARPFRPEDNVIEGDYFEAPEAGPEKPKASGWTRP